MSAISDPVVGLIFPFDDSSQAGRLQRDIHDAFHPEEPDDVGVMEGKTAPADAFCQFCNTRIDEKGWCGCDTIGGD